MSSTALLYCNVHDPKTEKRTIRDLFRLALLNKDVATAVAEVVGDGIDLGHKVLVWDRALAIVEKHLGDDLDSFQDATRYAKANQLRMVMRERIEIDKRWKMTGRIAKRLSAPTE